MGERGLGEGLGKELVCMVEAMLAETELRAFRGEKTVEIKPVWVNKGEALERLLAAQPQPDFLFAAGDDRTDEDLFERTPGDAWTLHVGPGPPRAAFSPPPVASFPCLLVLFS